MAEPAPISVLKGANRSERRKKPRKSAISLSLVTVEMDTNGFGLMLDVSEDGASIQVMSRVEPASLIPIAFKLPEMESRIEGNALVAWYDGEGRTGVRFQDLKADGRENLKQWITSLPESFSETSLAGVPVDADIREQLQAIQAQMASAHLDVEAVLQLLLERIAELTRCNGAAIALGESDQMVCRASTGLAPDVGVVIGSGSVLTAECLRTGKIVRCDDTELDVRVDEEICRELSLRSAAIVPIYFQGRMRGVLEVFSPIPNAFDDQHVRLLQHFADFTAENAYGAKESPVTLIPEPPKAAEPVAAKPAEPTPVKTESGNGSSAVTQQVPPPKFASVTDIQLFPSTDSVDLEEEKSARSRLRIFAVAAIVILVAAIGSLGWWYGRSSAVNTTPATTTQQIVPPTPVSPQPAASSTPATSERANEPKPAESQPSQQSQPTQQVVSSEPSRSLIAADVVKSPKAAVVLADPTTPLVLATTRERVPKAPEITAEAPAINAASNASLREITLPVETTSQPKLIPQGVVTGGTLIHRVEPEYPSFAKQQRVQGEVALSARVLKDGTVSNIKRIRGNPILGPSAIAAVRQWRYEPYRLNGQLQDVDITITVQFRLRP